MFVVSVPRTGEHKLWFHLLYSSIKNANCSSRAKRKLMNSISRRNLLLHFQGTWSTVIYLMVGNFNWVGVLGITLQIRSICVLGDIFPAPTSWLLAHLHVGMHKLMQVWTELTQASSSLFSQPWGSQTMSICNKTLQTVERERKVMNSKIKTLKCILILIIWAMVLPKLP